MSNKVNVPDQTVLLAEAIIKLAAMERLLVKAGIFTADELTAEMQLISKEITAIMLQKTLEPTKPTESN